MTIPPKLIKQVARSIWGDEGWDVPGLTKFRMNRVQSALEASPELVALIEGAMACARAYDDAPSLYELEAAKADLHDAALAFARAYRDAGE